MAKANLLTGIQNLLRWSTRPAADALPALALPPAGGASAGLRLDRFRTHPQLVEVWADAPPARRTRFSLEPGGDTIGEMPRGVTRFLLRLPDDPPVAGLSWQTFATTARQVTFVGCEPLQPRVSEGTRLRLMWDPPAGLPRVRIVPLSWTGGRSPVVAPPVVVPAGASGWEIPAHWLTTDPLELRLTPVGDGTQGPTECLILPGRRPRVETVFRRLMLTPPGRSAPRRRLQVEVRAPDGRTPAVVVVEWLPRDHGVTGEVIRTEWPAGGTTVTVDLPGISMRGDRVAVLVEPAAGSPAEYAWFHADESGYGLALADAVLADGSGPEASAFEYTHGVDPPTGDPVRLLADPDPAGTAGAWPASVEVLAGEVGVGVDEFVRRPQAHVLDAHEPRLRDVRRRFGDPARHTVLGHLMQAADGLPPADTRRLEAYAAGCDDAALDRWLEAVAAGAAVDRLLPFWTDQKWAEAGAWAVVEAGAQLDDVRAEPLSALLAEVLPMGPLGGDLRRAVEQEERLPTADPAEFARAAVVRRWVLGAFADHWARLLPADADERCRVLTDRLRTAPATAARELADLRAGGAVRLRPSRGPLLLIESEPTLGGPLRVFDPRLRGRAAADWYRTLVRTRAVPAWPWFGLLPADQSSADVRAEWEAVRDRLPPTDRPPSDALADRLTELQAAVAPLDDDDLRRVAADTLSHAAALAEWLR